MPPPTDEPLLAVDEIQGNVVPGFKKDHQHFLFFSIADAAAARGCLSNMHDRISTAAEVFEAHTFWKWLFARLQREPDMAHFVFLNVALTASGLRKLITNPKEVDDFADPAFKVGLSERSTFIGDPKAPSDPGHASKWLVGGPKHPVDGVLIMASDRLAWLRSEMKKLEKEITSRGMSVVHRDEGDVGAAPKPGHEQFGFKDGISHPAVRGRRPKDPYDFVYARTFPPDKAFDALRFDFAGPGKLLVWPGHFIFGYGRQKPGDPRAYVSTDKPIGPAWADNGSFLVYRRLRQNPSAFWNFVESTSKALTKKYPAAALGKDRLAALLIGRWPSGTPIMRSPDKDIPMIHDGLNYFSYANKQSPALPGDTAPLSPADAHGAVCPLAAHIRKVNPRDEAAGDLGLPENNPTKSILRRGVTYAAGSADKGLLFVAYQSSIVDQFEFLMKAWVTKPNRPRDNAGHDPILPTGAGRRFNLLVDNASEHIPVLGDFVIPTGGEYFFSPSIAFFAKILASQKTPAPGRGQPSFR